MLNFPPFPSLTTTRLGMVWPGPKFRLDASGVATPAGKAVRYDPAVASVAVRLTMTAETPRGGTPPRPVAWTSMVVFGPTGLWVVRGSGIRAGGNSAYREPAPPVPSEYQPTTSAITCVKPTAL